MNHMRIKQEDVTLGLLIRHGRQSGMVGKVNAGLSWRKYWDDMKRGRSTWLGVIALRMKDMFKNIGFISQLRKLLVLMLKYNELIDLTHVSVFKLRPVVLSGPLTPGLNSSWPSDEASESCPLCDITDGLRATWLETVWY